MRKLIAPLLLCVTLAGCSNHEEKPATSETKNLNPFHEKKAGTTGSMAQTVSVLNNLPDAVSNGLKGKPVIAESWTDGKGENIIVLAEGPEGYHKNPIGTNADETGKQVPFHPYYKELSAVHYLKTDTGYRLLWKLTDRTEQCEFDMTVMFIKGAFSVTDLDKDGIAETTVQYKLACRSDVSPAYMKLIMHEDTVKYALRGSMWIKDSEEAKFTVTKSDVNLSALPGYKGNENDWYKAYGRYENEKGFTGAPAVFLDYARQRWLQFAVDSFE